MVIGESLLALFAMNTEPITKLKNVPPEIHKNLALHQG
jgi:hypothetical protein